MWNLISFNWFYWLLFHIKFKLNRTPIQTSIERCLVTALITSVHLDTAWLPIVGRPIFIQKPLTHQIEDQMVTILQTTLSKSFSWMKTIVFWFLFHWKLFPMILFTSTIIGWDNDLALNSRQAIIWTDDGICSSLGQDELTKMVQPSLKQHFKTLHCWLPSTCFRNPLTFEVPWNFSHHSSPPVNSQLFSEVAWFKDRVPGRLSPSRDQFRYAPSQWETLHCNNVSHWLGAYLDWSLHQIMTARVTCPIVTQYCPSRTVGWTKMSKWHELSKS